MKISEGVQKKCVFFLVVMLLSIGVLVSCGDDGPTVDAVAPGDAAPFSLRMADGSEIEEATHQQLVEWLESLDSDNHFLVMSHRGGFVQTMTDGETFYVQYNLGQHYEGVEYLDLDEITTLFSLYYQGDESWKEMVEWQEFE